MLRTIGGPSCIAKNRFSLPEELPLDWSAFLAALTNSTTEPNTHPATAMES